MFSHCHYHLQLIDLPFLGTAQYFLKAERNKVQALSYLRVRFHGTKVLTLRAKSPSRCNF